MRFFTRLVQLLLLVVGLTLVAYAGYTYVGPDLIYAIERAVPGGDNAQGEVATTRLRLPYPRGAGQSGIRLVVPRMRLDTNIREASWATSNQQGRLYSDWVIPYDAAGHLITTAQPGEAGNVVISGHNNLIGPNRFGVGLFAGLWDLKPGDSIYIVDAAGRAFEYRAAQSYSLKEEGEPQAIRIRHAQEILKDTGQPELTLLTCWNGPVAPLSGNTYRWIVRADLIGQVDPALLPAAN